MATLMLKLTVLILTIDAAARVFGGMVVRKDKHSYRYRSWSNLQGESVEVAASLIHEEYPECTIKVRSAESEMIPSTILPNIVFLYEDDDGMVVNRPETVEEVPIELTIWPELVGKGVEAAKKVILKEKPEAKIQTLSATSATDELDPNRVRLYVDSHDLVVEAPRSG